MGPAPGTDTATCQGQLGNGFCKENKNISKIENKIREECEFGDDVDSAGQAKLVRPPKIHGMRHSISQAALSDTFPKLECPTEIGLKSSSGKDSAFVPKFRSGSCSEIGPKPYMKDEYICVDNLCESLNKSNGFSSAGAFYGVFDGHGGADAASFTKKNLHLTMIIANAGDSRAVLGKRGRAIELSKDHRPNCTSERLRIEKLGGVVDDGYLNGQLSVARALGDWHMKGPIGSKCPLSSEPELQEVVLTEEDEFLIIGCDGLWDVMSSQYAVTIVRKHLMMHNDPKKCSKELVREALKRNTCDNLTVLVVCFSPNPPPRIEIPKSQKRRSISAEGLDLLKGVLSNA